LLVRRCLNVVVVVVEARPLVLGLVALLLVARGQVRLLVHPHQQIRLLVVVVGPVLAAVLAVQALCM
jgi:hypothetical protein